MKIVFVSNYLNHHQIPFSDEMYRLTNKNYFFIATEKMEEERLTMGWENDMEGVPYLMKTYETPDKCLELIREADVVIVGSAPIEITKERIDTGKVLLKYSERIYKDGLWKVLSPRGFFNMKSLFGNWRNTNMYILCASAYLAGDFSIWGYFQNRMYKWGYFPQTYCQDINKLMKRKEGKCEILWCSRFIKWKHPESVIKLAQHLKKKGIDYHITMIGVGEEREGCLKEINKKGLDKDISVCGPMAPQEVRKYMEKTRIFLMTSDYREGWGAVVNEAMNSGCAVVASHAIGAVPFLIKDNYNGCVYKNGRVKQLANIVEELILNPTKCQKLGENAYKTIIEEWNAENAAYRLKQLCEKILLHETFYVENGPCSIASPIKQWKMYKYIKRDNL